MPVAVPFQLALVIVCGYSFPIPTLVTVIFLCTIADVWTLTGCSVLVAQNRTRTDTAPPGIPFARHQLLGPREPGLLLTFPLAAGGVAAMGAVDWAALYVRCPSAAMLRAALWSA
jgi:hypothetical protein